VAQQGIATDMTSSVYADVRYFVSFIHSLRRCGTVRGRRGHSLVWHVLLTAVGIGRFRVWIRGRQTLHAILPL